MTKTNYLTERYASNLMQTNLYHTDGGAESFAQWKRRGPYYYFRWPKDAMDSSTRVHVTLKFAERFQGGQQPCILMFNQWRSAFRIAHKDGRISITATKEV